MLVTSFDSTGKRNRGRRGGRSCGCRTDIADIQEADTQSIAAAAENLPGYIEQNGDWNQTEESSFAAPLLVGVDGCNKYHRNPLDSQITNLLSYFPTLNVGPQNFYYFSENPQLSNTKSCSPNNYHGSTVVFHVELTHSSAFHQLRYNSELSNFQNSCDLWILNGIIEI